MPRPKRETPAQLTPGWPTTESADPIAEVARKFVLALLDAVGERSVRSVAKDAGVTHNSLASILAGHTWPDLATIAKLERGVDAALWPPHGGESGSGHTP
jgi:hypothetical protein